MASSVLRRSERVKPGDTAIVGFRPEHLHLATDSPVMTLTADLTENLGGSTQIYARPAEGAPVTLLVPGRPAIGQGDAIRVGIEPGHIYLFDQSGLAL